MGENGGAEDRIRSYDLIGLLKGANCPGRVARSFANFAPERIERKLADDVILIDDSINVKSHS